MKLKIAALASLLLIAAPVLAHDVKGRNGGRVVDAGPHHVELVVKDKVVIVYVSDAADKPVTITGFKGLAILTVSGKALRIVLEPQESTRLSGTSPVTLPANAKGVVQLTGPDGKTAQGRFQ